MTSHELFVSGDAAGDLDVEGGDVAGDLFEGLGALAPEQRDGEVLTLVFERDAIAHQAVARVDEFGQLVMLGG